MEKERFVRVWKKLNTEETEKHLLLIEDLYGSCGNCKKLGLNYLKDKVCPSCGTEFLYIATKMTNLAEVMKILKRLETENSKLILLEREDFYRAQAKDALNDLFKK